MSACRHAERRICRALIEQSDPGVDGPGARRIPRRDPTGCRTGFWEEVVFQDINRALTSTHRGGPIKVEAAYALITLKSRIVRVDSQSQEDY
jgi:hypothetical protein